MIFFLSKGGVKTTPTPVSLISLTALPYSVPYIVSYLTYHAAVLILSDYFASCYFLLLITPLIFAVWLNITQDIMYTRLSFKCFPYYQEKCYHLMARIAADFGI